MSNLPDPCDPALSFHDYLRLRGVAPNYPVQEASKRYHEWKAWLEFNDAQWSAEFFEFFNARCRDQILTAKQMGNVLLKFARIKNEQN